MRKDINEQHEDSPFWRAVEYIYDRRDLPVNQIDRYADHEDDKEVEALVGILVEMIN